MGEKPVGEITGDKESMQTWLARAKDKGASDIFIGAKRHITFKVNGVLEAQDVDVVNVCQDQYGISVNHSMELIKGLYDLADRSIDKYKESGDDDFPVTISGVGRFRVNTYLQRSTMAAIIRVVPFGIPDYTKLRIPDEVMSIANEINGLALVTGPAGSGKSTTLACVIDAINKARNSHIVTLEDPIEYIHKDNLSLVSQREISTDTNSYMDALRASLRQAPDIILLGEMRDSETIKTAMTAAETGHLVISTLHTTGAANTVDRIIDIFPPAQQQQIRVQLSMSLRIVVTQRLLQSVSGRSVPAFEIMRVNNAISNIIREGKTHQIDGVIQTSTSDGMIGMDASIMRLFRSGEITAETALMHASNTETMQRQMNAAK